MDAYALKADKAMKAPISFGFEDMVPTKEETKKEKLFADFKLTPKRKPVNKWNI